MTLELLTVEKLEAWLRSAGVLPEGRVTGIAVVPIGTFSSALSRIRVRYAGAPAGVPESFVVKSSVSGRDDRLGERFETEIRFYRELAPRTPVRTPRFYGGEVDEAGRGLLLVEDVADIGETDWMRGPTEAHARLAVAALARMHATWWDRVDALDWVPSFEDEGLLTAFEEAYDRAWRDWKPFFDELVPGFGRVGDALYGRVASSHRVLGDEPTLLHGDAHAENMPLVVGPEGDEVVLLDWAGPRRGSVGIDLGFFIATSFSAERRSGVERSLVAQHAEVIKAHGVEPTTDSQLAYRRGVLRRVSRLVAIAPGWDEAELAGLKMVFQRCGSAAVDLDVAELIV